MKITLGQLRMWGLGLGAFVNPDRVCPNGKCPTGWELYCGIRTPRNPNVCVIRLKKQFAKKARDKGECVYAVRDEESGKVQTCSASDVKKKKKGCKLSNGKKVVARECPPQRRRREYESGLMPGGRVKPLKKRKKKSA